MVWSRRGPRTGEQPLAEIRTPPKAPLARPVHDPLAGLPPPGPPVHPLPPGRFPQGDLDWIVKISNAPADPIPVPAAGTGGLVESGQMVLFGASLSSFSGAPATVNFYDGMDVKGGLVAQLVIPPSTSSQTSADASAAFAAGVAGSAALLAGQLITGFTVTLASGGTAAGTVTVSGLLGGVNLVYDLPAGATSLSVQFPQPLNAAAAAAITVAVSAITGGGAGHVNITGLAVSGAAAPVQLNIPRAGILLELGLFMTVTGGIVTGTAYVAHLWKYPFTPPGE